MQNNLTIYPLSSALPTLLPKEKARFVFARKQCDEAISREGELPHAFIPYRRLCRHFAYAADAPLLSLSRHFPRFSGGIYPEGGSKKYVILSASEISHRKSTGHKLCRPTPFREIAAVASLLRKDSKTNRASSFGGSGTKCR